MSGLSRLCSLRTNSCCCGISLRTGTIIILVLNLIGGLSISVTFRILTRYGMGTGLWIGKIIFNFIEVFALLGVFKKKAAYLIPHLVVAAIVLIILSLMIIGNIIMIPFAEKILADVDVTYETSDGKTEHVKEVVKDSFYVIYAGVILVEILLTAIEFHFFKVVLSYYVELKTVLFCVTSAQTIGFVA